MLNDRLYFEWQAEGHAKGLLSLDTSKIPLCYLGNLVHDPCQVQCILSINGVDIDSPISCTLNDRVSAVIRTACTDKVIIRILPVLKNEFDDEHFDYERFLNITGDLEQKDATDHQIEITALRPCSLSLLIHAQIVDTKELFWLSKELSFL